MYKSSPETSMLYINYTSIKKIRGKKKRMLNKLVLFQKKKKDVQKLYSGATKHC